MKKGMLFFILSILMFSITSIYFPVWPFLIIIVFFTSIIYYILLGTGIIKISNEEKKRNLRTNALLLMIISFVTFWSTLILFQNIDEFTKFYFSNFNYIAIISFIISCVFLIINKKLSKGKKPLIFILLSMIFSISVLSINVFILIGKQPEKDSFNYNWNGKYENQYDKNAIKFAKVYKASSRLHNQIIKTRDNNYVFTSKYPEEYFEYICMINSSGEFKWRYDIKNVDWITSILECEDNSILILCSYFPKNYRKRIKIIKVNNLGHKVWEKNYSDEDSRILGTRIISSRDGGYLILGRKSSKEKVLFKEINTLDLLLLKIDEDGNEVWRKTFHKKLWESDGIDIVPFGENGYLILDEAESNNYFTYFLNRFDCEISHYYNNCNIFPDYTSIILRYVDEDGNLIWRKELQGDVGGCILLVIQT